MEDFHKVLVQHRQSYNLDRDTVCKQAHINFQTIRKIECGELSNVTARDFLSYLRITGFKISTGTPRMK